MNLRDSASLEAASGGQGSFPRALVLQQDTKFSG